MDLALFDFDATITFKGTYGLADYATVHAYGDTEEDRQMLEMADKRYFRWKEVREVPAVSQATRRSDEGP